MDKLLILSLLCGSVGGLYVGFLISLSPKLSSKIKQLSAKIYKLLS